MGALPGTACAAAGHTAASRSRGLAGLPVGSGGGGPGGRPGAARSAATLSPHLTLGGRASTPGSQGQAGDVLCARGPPVHPEAWSGTLLLSLPASGRVSQGRGGPGDPSLVVNCPGTTPSHGLDCWQGAVELGVGPAATWAWPRRWDGCRRGRRSPCELAVGPWVTDGGRAVSAE